jgi:hypothetical protein
MAAAHALLHLRRIVFVQARNGLLMRPDSRRRQVRRSHPHFENTLKVNPEYPAYPAGHS